ncbi:hypothetical protein BC792_12041 [Sphingobacterium allocomposti]|uniref:Uncharacterized protein n=1 Tax=Sphingobacterium allocomposti TaxID=415956 RepID=A0A5S5D5L2_9SPHI|nr:hypothetical protein [Sphingobacterium composti Yoo et al. 2007 non Ten et al. 2007]TYP91333.1 hypothetical protein BC792_12041 [Sphingobacterium composti Yoo et al. 2007 non Ten et al. 2007]
MKKIIRKVRDAVQVVLLAPVKLPGKVLGVLKYVALGLGILETVLEEDEGQESPPAGKEEGHEGAE